MENWRKLSQNYHQILLLNKSSDTPLRYRLNTDIIRNNYEKKVSGYTWSDLQQCFTRETPFITFCLLSFAQSPFIKGSTFKGKNFFPFREVLYERANSFLWGTGRLLSRRETNGFDKFDSLESKCINFP